MDQAFEFHCLWNEQRTIHQSQYQEGPDGSHQNQYGTSSLAKIAVMRYSLS
jgi:hypothetical protein